MVPFHHAGGAGLLDGDGEGDALVGVRVADGVGDRVAGGRVAVGEVAAGVGASEVGGGAGGVVAGVDRAPGSGLPVQPATRLKATPPATSHRSRWPVGGVVREVMGRRSSTFGTVRLGTWVTKGPGSRAGVAIAFKQQVA